mgnify:CR=1 FL=1
MKNLKVLMLNGSPHANGNTAVALREMEEIFKASGRVPADCRTGGSFCIVTH